MVSSSTFLVRLWCLESLLLFSRVMWLRMPLLPPMASFCGRCGGGSYCRGWSQQLRCRWWFKSKEFLRWFWWTTTSSTLFLFTRVSRSIKLAKQNYKRECIANKDILHPPCKLTTRENGIETKNDSSRKLYQLQDCQVLFPPEILLNFRSHGCHSIVSVHDNMDKAVNHGSRESRPSWNETGSNPPKEEHSWMMVDV